MNLRNKVYSVVVITWFVILITIALASYYLILSDYSLLEKDGIKENYTRATEALHRSREALNLLGIDWAHWDDTYNFIKDENEKYTTCSLVIVCNDKLQ